ncbi:ParA family protein (plasmid) [Burkholderia aenigmatica]|uniref:ParA family protein n=1 Tax=Burkholderia aenigmatica TaxID=2015348 RepID=UPI003B43C7D8
MLKVAVTNQKGGVGKTTTAVHLADYAANELGLRTALVDADEGDVSEVFPQTAVSAAAHALTTGEIFRGNPRGLRPRQVGDRLSVVDAEPDLLDLHDLPVDVLAELEVELGKPDGAFDITRMRSLFGEIQERLTLPFDDGLASMAADFDICIIDTPPHLARRALGVLCSVDAVVTPTNISVFTMARIAKLQQTLDSIKREFNPNLKQVGFLMCKINSKSPSELGGVAAMRQEFGDLILKQVVMDRVSVSTSLAQGRPVWRGASAGAQRVAAKEMIAACAEVFGRLGITKEA